MLNGNGINICKRCVLPENFPGVVFDNNGVCNHCRNFIGEAALIERKKECEQKFLRLIDQYGGQGEYDVLMCFSGGKDSTYTLDLFKSRYNLNVLALTFDNGFISPSAMENMKNVSERIDVDHMIFKIRFGILKQIFSAAATTELYPKKTLERASTICTSCIGFVKFAALKIAQEKGIPFIGYGWSPGQAPIQSSIMKNNPAMIRMTQRIVYEPMLRIVGEDIKPYFLGEEYFANGKEFSHNIHPLAFLKYDEAMIFERIKKLGWIKPDDTDPNSTNCLLNAYANEVHENKFGYNPYVFEIAKMVREGILIREEGMKKFSEKIPSHLVSFAKDRLEIESSP